MLSSRHRIFVSHSHLDNEFGMQLAQDLRSALTEESAVFYDVLGGLHGGDSWWNKIVEELTTRDVFLLILSPDAMNSRWVRREIDTALNEDKLILPLLYRTCTIRADLKTIYTISFLAPKPYEAAFQEILVALHLPVEMAVVPKKSTDAGQRHDKEQLLETAAPNDSKLALKVPIKSSETTVIPSTSGVSSDFVSVILWLPGLILSLLSSLFAFPIINLLLASPPNPPPYPISSLNTSAAYVCIGELVAISISGVCALIDSTPDIMETVITIATIVILTLMILLAILYNNMNAYHIIMH